MKLRKGSRYAITTTENGATLMAEVIYQGKHENDGRQDHLFTFIGDEFSGYWFDDNGPTTVLEGVQPMTPAVRRKMNRMGEAFLRSTGTTLRADHQEL